MPGIYVHIPFCRRKCIYCDFFSVGARNAPWPQFTQSLLNELSARSRGGYDTIYIGGGTPSLMPPEQLRSLCRALREVVPDYKEFTVEVNPEGVTAEFVELLGECGINRVSMGVQSFNDAELKAIGRRHTAEDALRAYRLLRPIGNVSIDLIFGLPSQSFDSWRRSVATALELRPEHISAYSLMWEEGTALSLMRRQGRVQVPEEGGTVRLYTHLREELRKAGYMHYEISNYALPGRESRHNSSYWRGEPYLGLGPGAHGYDGASLREANPCDIEGYIRNFTSAKPEEFAQKELLSSQELREEYIMTRLRTCEGIPLEDFALRHGDRQAETLMKKARRQIAAGNIEEKEGCLSLTPEGVMLLDAITVDLL